MDVDPATGHLFVADQGNARVVEITAWGEFVKAWGWDVVASGPGDDAVAPEDEFEVCVPANGDACKAGVQGGGAGQFKGAGGVAVDSSGNVYVTDRGLLSNPNLRVQKFAPSGQFLLMFGGDVNQTKVAASAPEAQRNICPVDPGDVCKSGTQGTGDGQFGAWAVGSFIDVKPGSPDTVYVGDDKRIQLFEQDGTYLGDFPDPEGLIAGEKVQALGLDASGNLFVAFDKDLSASEPDVVKLTPTGAKSCTATVADPRALAVGPAGEVYVVDGSKSLTTELTIRKFDSSCQEDAEFAFFDDFATSTGIATSTACDVPGTDLFVSNAVQADSFVRAYGPAPDPLLCPPPKVPPSIEEQYAVAVGTESALVQAEIDPRFWGDATYYVQYGTADCATNPCAEKPLPPGADLGGAVREPLKTAEVLLAQLQPDTTYFFRFVAKSGGGGPVAGEGAGAELGGGDFLLEGETGSFTTFPPVADPKSDCPNQSLRSGPSAVLPDCRAYEMVSPVDKGGGDLAVLPGASDSRPARLDQAAPDGEAVVYSSSRAFGEVASAPFTSHYLASRDPNAGWSTMGISPRREGRPIYEGFILDTTFKAFSPDLCWGWFLQDTALPAFDPEALPDYPNLYRRDNCSASDDVVLTEQGAGLTDAIDAFGFRPSLQGFSSDGRHAFFRICDEGSGETCTRFVVYEHFEEELHPVCILPDETPYPGDCSLGTVQSGPTDTRDDSVDRAVSADGSRAFWTAIEASGGLGALHVRIDGQETLEISSGPAFFHAASIDGSKAIYSVGETLFEYDVDSEAETEIASGVKGVLGTSADASRIYLISTEVLTGEQLNSENDKAVDGAPNLYLFEAGDGGTAGSFSFIGTLSAPDAEVAGALSPIATRPYYRTSRVTPDGLRAAFMSRAPLTDYDNADAANGEPDTEVFLYDATLGQLDCASCNPTGARPKGRKVTIGNAIGVPVAAQLPGWEYQMHAPRSLSDDGRRLYFESFDRLVPRDTNGEQDVYQWQRAAGEEQCVEGQGGDLFVASSGGCLSLMSTGESSEPSEFVDASGDGEDVFIKTFSKLAPQDPGLRDMYDARELGGFAPPPPPPAPCQGAACQSSAPPPDDPSPASAATRSAPSALAERPKPCGKGKRRVVRKGKARCVKRKNRRGKGQQRSRRAGK
ncbi:MAG TPA: hypothetical protein VEQ41_01595 [Solirubrobacterales bacterium]|nr:hypothetical protein [Solirubrobacterales bacterium]